MNTFYQVQTFNTISSSGLDRFPAERYRVSQHSENPDVLLLRSFDLHEFSLPTNLKAVGRAGAGVNNIPIQKLSALGVPIFNAPGANANAVKELVITGMMLAMRNICESWAYVDGLSGSDAEIRKAVEAGKKQFAGCELPGRTLGVVGLGAIGRLVANIAIELGLTVVGYDPLLTVDGALALSSRVQRVKSLNALLQAAEMVTFHVPLVESTRNMINAQVLAYVRPGCVLMNFARSGILDDNAVLESLNQGRLSRYVTDFPDARLIGHDRVIALPHLGASTREAEENCAVMVVDHIRDFLENGNIRNSVNFPEVVIPRGSPYRLVIANNNVPNMVGQISTVMADAGLNISNMMNQSKQDLAYTAVDLDSRVPAKVVAKLSAIEGVLNVRVV